MTVTPHKKLSDRELNRALLIRQGLIEPFGGTLPEAVEAIGAIQAQYWPAVAGSVFSRTDGVTLADVYKAFERRDLVVGTLIRGTIHVVSAAEHPLYSAVAKVTGVDNSRVKGAATDAGLLALREATLEFAAEEPRLGRDFAAFAEEWVADHPGAISAPVLEYHQSTSWRPIYSNVRLIRLPKGGDWGAAAGPLNFLRGPELAPDADAAFEALIRRHLNAFGPSAADDVAAWLGRKVPVTRAALEAMDDLVTYADENGRVLYDLPGAPLPGADVKAPPRLLPRFDSTLLAHAVKFRHRIIADDYREAVYFGKNLQILPTFLIDGFVAGTWSAEAKKKLATVTLRPLAPLKKADRKPLLEEAERIARLQFPDSAEHAVVFEE
jgi:hypothetical protein